MLEEAIVIGYVTKGMFTIADLRALEWKSYEYLKNRANELLKQEPDNG